MTEIIFSDNYSGHTIMHKPSLIAALLTVAYFVLSIGALQLLNFDPPARVEQLISLSAAPAVILLTVWTPVFKRLGMVSGEWLTVPSLPACMLLIALYTALAYLATGFVYRLIVRVR